MEELKTLQSTIINLENRTKVQNNTIEDLSKRREELEAQFFSEKRDKDNVSRYLTITSTIQITYIWLNREKAFLTEDLSRLNKELEVSQSQLEEERRIRREEEKDLEEMRRNEENLRVELERSERTRQHVEKQFGEFKNESLKFKSSIDISAQEKYRLQVK